MLEKMYANNMTIDPLLMEAEAKTTVDTIRATLVVGQNSVMQWRGRSFMTRC